MDEADADAEAWKREAVRERDLHDRADRAEADARQARRELAFWRLMALASCAFLLVVCGECHWGWPYWSVIPVTPAAGSLHAAIEWRRIRRERRREDPAAPSER